jgi:hypothetical protein
VAVETQFLFPLDLNDARIMDDDFDRPVSKAVKGRGDVREILFVDRSSADWLV